MILTVLAIGALLVCSILSFIALGFSTLVPWLFLIAIAIIVIWSRYKEKSNHVAWNDSYSVGIADIDNDHKQLINLINRFQTAVHYNTGSGFEQEALDELVDYTKYHFAKEEELLEKHKYPEFGAHKQEHEKMIAKVVSFIEAHRANGHESLAEIADFLRDWLINHINGTDKKYSKFLHSKGVN